MFSLSNAQEVLFVATENGQIYRYFVKNGEVVSEARWLVSSRQSPDGQTFLVTHPTLPHLYVITDTFIQQFRVLPGKDLQALSISSSGVSLSDTIADVLITPSGRSLFFITTTGVVYQYPLLPNGQMQGDPNRIKPRAATSFRDYDTNKPIGRDAYVENGWASIDSASRALFVFSRIGFMDHSMDFLGRFLLDQKERAIHFTQIEKTNGWRLQTSLGPVRFIPKQPFAFLNSYDSHSSSLCRVTSDFRLHPIEGYQITATEWNDEGAQVLAIAKNGRRAYATTGTHLLALSLGTSGKFVVAHRYPFAGVSAAQLGANEKYLYIVHSAKELGFTPKMRVSILPCDLLERGRLTKHTLSLKSYCASFAVL